MVFPACPRGGQTPQLDGCGRDLPAGCEGPHRGATVPGPGDTVLLVGHDGHDETEGTLGEGDIQLVRTAVDAARVQVDDPSRVSYLTQTTLAVDEVASVVDVLRERFPLLSGPPTEDICYATTNRQHAVLAIAAGLRRCHRGWVAELVELKRLVEVAERAGTPAYLVDDASSVAPEWIMNARRIGPDRRRIRTASPSSTR